MFIKIFTRCISIIVLVSTMSVTVQAKYTAFIEQQLAFEKVLNDEAITNDALRNIVQEQKTSYLESLERIMSDKESFMMQDILYKNELFSLQKILQINTKIGNEYAILRDEIQINSYTLLQNQSKMLESILFSLDTLDKEAFRKKLDAIVAKNLEENQALNRYDYEKIMKIQSSSKSLKIAKENLKEFYALLDINADVISYIYLFEDTMHKLNKYSKYKLVGTVIEIQNSSIVKVIHPFLEFIGMDAIKLIIIVICIIILYSARKIVYIILEKYIQVSTSQNDYKKNILDAIHKPVEFMMLAISCNAISYIYYDFYISSNIEKVFHIMYALLFTILFYRLMNAIALAKLSHLDATNTQIKNDVINVAVKIINFIIFIVGLLFILHLAGANLTAVLSGLGIGGLAVALAAKEYLANFFGTLTILFSDVFSQGDWIEVNGKEGVVIEIGTRVTTLRTFDNALIAIPNAILANQDVKNWDKRSLGRRIKMNLGIRYDSKSEDIKKAILDIREMLDVHSSIATENTKYAYKQREGTRIVSKDDAQGIKKTLLVYLDAFSDSHISILVYCFTKSVEWEEWLATKEDVMHKIMEIFEKNNLEFAFPSLSLYTEGQELKA